MMPVSRDGNGAESFSGQMEIKKKCCSNNGLSWSAERKQKVLAKVNNGFYEIDIKMGAFLT
jgi:hypothetical protein